MKKFLKILAIILLMFFPIINIFAEEELDTLDPLTFTPAAGAREAEEQINRSMFSANSAIDSSKNINGINFVAGNIVTVNNYNEYGAYAGNIITINSQIEKELFVAGNDIKITNLASLGRDAYIACSSLTLETNVEGDLHAIGSKLVLENTTISGDADLSFDRIVFKDNVVIDGTLKYSDDTEVEGIEGATINKVEKYNYTATEEANSQSQVTNFILSLISLIVVACVINALFPKIYSKLNKSLETSRIFKNMAFGFLFLIALPLAFVILVITRIGIGLGFLFLTLYIILLFLSILLPMSIIGNNLYKRVFKKKDNSYISIILGILVVELVGLIPFVGGIVTFLLFLIGLGYSLELLFKNK